MRLEYSNNNCTLSAAAKSVTCSEPRVLFIGFTPIDLILGIYHQTVNLYRIFSILLYLYEHTNLASYPTVVVRSGGWRFVESFQPQLQKTRDLIINNFKQTYNVTVIIVRPRVVTPFIPRGKAGLLLIPNRIGDSRVMFHPLLAHWIPTNGIAYTTQRLLLVNRLPHYGRHVNITHHSLAHMCRAISHIVKGTCQFAEEIDMVQHKNRQDLPFVNATIVISPHGQQLSNIVYAPKCAIVIELFNHNGFTTEYASMSIDTGHIWTHQYDTNASHVAACGRFGSTYGTLRQTGGRRFCIRNQATYFDQKDAIRGFASLLPLQKRCLLGNYTPTNLTKLTLRYIKA